MLLQIPDVLSVEQVAQCRRVLDAAEWVDGRVTAGFQSARTKDNLQIPADHPAAIQCGDMIVAALERTSLFLSAALPLRVFPPLFNRYSGGQAFGTHVDNAIRQVAGTPRRIRTDLSATLFLSSPEDYEGGELVVEDSTPPPASTMSARSRAAPVWAPFSGSKAWWPTIVRGQSYSTLIPPSAFWGGIRRMPHRWCN
jgi:predicted 2-oxoglutarate/Fe(II)-dependent dioxygenase YbiX